MSLVSPVITHAFKLRHKHPVIFFCSSKLLNLFAKAIWLVPQDVINNLFFNEEMCCYYSVILKEKLTVVDEYGHSIVESYNDSKVSVIDYDIECKTMVVAALMKLVHRATTNSNNLTMDVVNPILQNNMFNVLDVMLESSNMDNGLLNLYTNLLSDLARSYECSQYIYANRGGDVMKLLANTDNPNIISG